MPLGSWFGPMINSGGHVTPPLPGLNPADVESCVGSFWAAPMGLGSVDLDGSLVNSITSEHDGTTLLQASGAARPTKAGDILQLGGSQYLELSSALLTAISGINDFSWFFVGTAHTSTGSPQYLGITRLTSSKTVNAYKSSSSPSNGLVVIDTRAGTARTTFGGADPASSGLSIRGLVAPRGLGKFLSSRQGASVEFSGTQTPNTAMDTMTGGRVFDAINPSGTNPTVRPICTAYAMLFFASAITNEQITDMIEYIEARIGQTLLGF